VAAVVLAAASVATLFGVIHSPLPGGQLFWPWTAPGPLPSEIAGAYGVSAGLCWLAVSRLARGDCSR
jgi:hypothetical protein